MSRSLVPWLPAILTFTSKNFPPFFLLFDQLILGLTKRYVHQLKLSLTLITEVYGGAMITTCCVEACQLLTLFVIICVCLYDIIDSAVPCYPVFSRLARAFLGMPLLDNFACCGRRPVFMPMGEP